MHQPLIFLINPGYLDLAKKAVMELYFIYSA
jgi:hypothetical protein